MAVDVESLKDKVAKFASRFFSLIIAGLNCIASLVLIIGFFKFAVTQGTFYRTEVAHFFTAVISTASTVGFLALHLVPRKRYRVLYMLSGLLVLSIFFTAHSLGLVAPTVDDCDEKGLLYNVSTLFNTTTGTAQDAVDAVTNRNQTTSITTSLIGSLGQSLGNCVDSEIIFAGSFMLIIFHIISLFDTQRMLVSRIKSKTYGERFVEMGIR
jgi:hypothetical protein